jgi:hypothetical protein
MMKRVFQVAEAFTCGGKILDIQEYGNGNINDTYLVAVDGEPEDFFVLQRINNRVFTRPILIIQNLRTLTEHVGNRLKHDPDDPLRSWDVPHIRRTCSGCDYHIDPQGSFWRGLSFINDSQSYETVLDEQHALEAGYALGRFQSLVSDLDVARMHDTLEGFHITPGYLANYDAILTRDPRLDHSPEAEYCHQMIEARRSWATVLEEGKDSGELQMRIIHGDPKINNFMISNRNGQAVSVVDLDTVKPGLVHYDIGDCLRSSCNPLGEETTDFENVKFDINLARTILEGYVSVADQFLTRADYAYMYDSICLIPFELGLRFFSDYLARDVYFKVKHDKHNLERALVQFKLTESVEAQSDEIREIIVNIKDHAN